MRLDLSDITLSGGTPFWVDTNSKGKYTHNFYTENYVEESGSDEEAKVWMSRRYFTAGAGEIGFQLIKGN